jgi:glucose/arabinose dehydrogenase
MLRLFAVFLATLVAAAAQAAPTVTDNSLSIEKVAGGLAVPTTMAFIGADDFLVLEKETGQVRRVTNGTLNPTPVLDLAVNGCDERGLLGIAVHPDFAAAMDPKPWVYLYYTSSGEASDISNCDFFFPPAANLLDRFEWNGSALVNGTNLSTFPSYVSYHNGGPLAFGPDKKLYGVNGDGEQDGAPQNFESGLFFDDTSVIFRLNDDGSAPTDNPFSMQADPATPRYYAYGIRNSFGLAFDPFSGDLWDTENGAEIYDEINRVVPGANSGWRDIMGPGVPAMGTLLELTGSTYIQPAYSIQTPVAPTGLAFASSNSTLGASNQGNLYVADYELGNIYEFEVNSARTGLDYADILANNQTELNAFRFATGFTGGLSDLEEGPDGNLYAVAIASGEVWRITGGGGGEPASYDLAVSKVKAPKKISLSDSKPTVLKDVKVTLVNQGNQTETIGELEIGALVTLDWTSLPPMACLDPSFTLKPPKKGFPIVLEQNKKVNLAYTVTWECANDPLQSNKDADHADFEVQVTVDRSVLGAEPDADPSNDVCPRPASAEDKGCGGKDANGDVGGPIRTDVVNKDAPL